MPRTQGPERGAAHQHVALVVLKHGGRRGRAGRAVPSRRLPHARAPAVAHVRDRRPLAVLVADHQGLGHRGRQRARGPLVPGPRASPLSARPAGPRTHAPPCTRQPSCGPHAGGCTAAGTGAQPTALFWCPTCAACCAARPGPRTCCPGARCPAPARSTPSARATSRPAPPARRPVSELWSLADGGWCYSIGWP